MTKLYLEDFFGDDLSHAHRPTNNRLETILSHFPDGGFDRVLDIGCCSGFFCFGMAAHSREILGIDKQIIHLSMAQASAKRHNVTNCQFREQFVEDLFAQEPDRVWDAVVYMSVHHHMVGKYGWDEAAKWLRKIWDRTESTLFFEMGQKNESVNRSARAHWWNALPHGDPVALHERLLERLPDADFAIIGGSKVHSVTRHLWKVTRRK